MILSLMTMLMEALQFQCVSINDSHGVVVVHHIFGVNRYVVEILLLMALLCLVKII